MQARSDGMDWGPQVRGLEGKVCLVTGASTGIGQGIATALGEQGAKVYITSRSLGRLEATAAAIRERGGIPVPMQVDHSQQDEIEGLFKKISQDEGKLDILVNNCFAAIDGIFNSETRGLKFWERDLSWFDTVNNVGLKAHFVASQLAVPLMLQSSSKSNPGLIVHVSSVGGLVYLFDVAYGVGKAALDRMAQDMAVELRENNIAVVSLWPGGAVVTDNIQSLVLDDPAVMQSNTLKDRLLSAASWSLDKLTTSPEFMTEFKKGESPIFVGRAVSSLARMRGASTALEYTGKVIFTADLADRFGFKQDDGSQPKSYRSVSRLLDEVVPGLGSAVPREIKIPASLLGLVSQKF
eukprot:Tamp_14979.p1 GENE.Tamp_14979~~Tamp_14979.p1  ORF type:complete len:404 (-),score=63.82 Tamp_14979:371-1426(-)